MLSELDQNILQCVMEAERPIPNRVLAIQCGVSVNTIRKEIVLLNESLREYGALLVSKSSVGCYLEVTDPQKARKKLETLRTYLQRRQRIHIYASPYVYHLIRKCLSGGNLTVENLCQELYCSRGTLTRDLNTARKILERFHLTLNNRRNGGGLEVEGKEWDIRQCLIFQHKIYKNFADSELGRQGESTFEALFYMQNGEEHYNSIRADLDCCLRNQRDFTIPLAHLPKIAHYIQLSLSRKKWSNEIRFTEEQIHRAIHTHEYALAQKVCAMSEERFGKKIMETDVIGVSMLLLSYETRNFHLSSMEEYQSYRDETEQMINLLSEKWEHDRNLYDEVFCQDWICFLYTLKNRLIFGVYQDGECVGAVEKKGIGSADSCLMFARLYEEKHGIRLDRENTLSAYYLFHRIRKKDVFCYYMQNVLVVSQYGYPSASAIASSIRKGYREEIGRVTPIEIGEYVENTEDYDLLITDLEKGRRIPNTVMDYYKLPVLTVKFFWGSRRSAELDDYLLKVQRRCERMILRNDCFYRTFLQTKEEVFERMAEEICSWRHGEKREIVRYLKENDLFTEMERANGVVFFPVLTDGWSEQRLVILLNHKAIRWNESRSQIFVCYNRPQNMRSNYILNNLLQKFVHISALTADALLHSGKSPIEILYPEIP